MTRYNDNRLPPTALQVEAFQALVIHRSIAAAAKAVGREWTNLEYSVHGFLRRTHVRAAIETRENRQ